MGTRIRTALLRRPFTAWLLWALLICSCAGLLSVWLGPDESWDLRFYHLYAPWAYLHGRYLYDIGPAQCQGFFNPTSDFLFYGLISSKLNDFPRLVAFVMGAVHGLNGVMILAIARHLIRPRQPAAHWILVALAFLLGVSGTDFVSLLGMTSNDLINSIFVLASLLCVLKAAEATAAADCARRLALAGLCIGAAVGLKYTAAVFVPGVGLIAIVAAVRRRTVIGPVGFGAAAAVAVAAVAGYHLLTLWRDFGNPVFPFVNEVFRSPYYEPVSLRDTQFVPRDIWQALFYPFYWVKTNSYVVSEVRFRDWRGATAYVAVAAAVLKLAAGWMRKAKPSEAACAETPGLGLFVVFLVVSFALWELTFGIYRYGAALEMLCGVAAMAALIPLFSGARTRIAAAVIVCAVVMATAIYPSWERGRFGNRYVDVRVPALPANSIVLLATGQPAAYFIPFATPSARYLGIENNYLHLSQHNILADDVRRLMRTPGPAKFILSFGTFNAAKLNAMLANFSLRLAAAPCRPIWSNLELDALSLCPAEAADTQLGAGAAAAQPQPQK